MFKGPCSLKLFSPIDHKCLKYSKQQSSQLVNCQSSTEMQIYYKSTPARDPPLATSGRWFSHFMHQISTCNYVGATDFILEVYKYLL